MKRAPLLGSLVVAVFAGLLIGCFRNDGPLEWKDTVPPGKVINLTVVEAAGDSVVLTWSAPGNDGDSGAVSGYELRYAPQIDSAFEWDGSEAVRFGASVHRPGAIEHTTVHGLDSTTTYRFAIRAYDEAGNESEMSNIVDEYFVVVIPDPYLAEELRILAYHDSLPLHISDLLIVYVFRNESDSITDLRGLEQCVNLRSLYLTRCDVSSIEPVANLKRMLGIYLTSTRVTDIRPVAGMATLRALIVQDCELKDILSVRGLTDLYVLGVAHTEVKDISPVAGLSGLHTLDLRFGAVTDLEPVRSLSQLVELSISRDSVRSLAPLADLTALQYLTADYCGLTDLTPLSDLPNLKKLKLTNNALTTLRPLVDNPGIDDGDSVIVVANPLLSSVYSDEIPALEARGVGVRTHY